MFDGEIMHRIGDQDILELDEERTRQIKELLIEKVNLGKNIRENENLFIKKKENEKIRSMLNI